MAAEEVSADCFLRELYEMTGGEATTLVRGEDLARRLGVDPDRESDEAGFLGVVRRLEERVREVDEVQKFDRLKALKLGYVPQNLFRLNQYIRPTSNA